MKIIISPAKQMRQDNEVAYNSLPVFIQDSEKILKKMQKMSLEQLQCLWNCNDKLAQQNYQRIINMDLYNKLTPALLSYVGLQYTSLGVAVLDNDAWEYLCENLFILSGFYGLLRANDGISPYRLEMQAKLAVDSTKNLYQFWQDKLYKYLIMQDKIIINLASKEYSKAIEPYLNADVKFITCVFAQGNKDNYKVKATEAKMARGSMVRWCAERKIANTEELKQFNIYGYKYCEEISSANKYVFIK